MVQVKWILRFAPRFHSMIAAYCSNRAAPIRGGTAPITYLRPYTEFSQIAVGKGANLQEIRFRWIIQRNQSEE
jgi:hypothetical protein